MLARKKVDLPSNLDNLAQELLKIHNKYSKINLNSVKENKKDDGYTSYVDWFTKQINSIPENIDDWSSRDFVHWFVREREKTTGMSYVIEYSRDCSAIKKIVDAFIEAGLPFDNNEIKIFIEWSLENYQYITEQYDRYDLLSIHKSINDYLQQKNNNNQESERENVNIIQSMKDDYNAHSQKERLLILLMEYGIPLTIQFYVSYGNDVDKVQNGIMKKLQEVSTCDKISLENIFRQSINFSPYPDFFDGNKWREIYSEIIQENKIPSKKWWRPQDYSGKHLSNYNNFRKEK